jgi:hypothetical protein
VIGANKARTIEEWTSILKQAHRWQTPDIKQLAATRLHRIPMDPVEKIALWRRCSLHNSGYLFGSYLAICQRPESLSLEEARLLGIETFVKVAGVRDRIRKEECEARLRRVSGPKLGKMQEAEAEEEEKRRVEKMVREVFGLHT